MVKDVLSHNILLVKFLGDLMNLPSDVKKKLSALEECAKYYLDFFYKCLEQEDYFKNYGASETNFMANKFSKALTLPLDMEIEDE